ncbi:MAG: transcriptional regulator [Nocardiaceae bacterium]|nr:transcriptional regulator [Nocardiaceae bacterium]
MRDLVRESWTRSIKSGIDPENALATIHLAPDSLEAIREAHPLAVAMPVVRRLLVDSAAEAGLLVAVSDAAGQLLWVEGSPRMRTRAEDIHFVPGADWSEASAGTNAPGTSLELDRPVQIHGPEHLSRIVMPWSCTAVPIHDPENGSVLGMLDLTGGPDAVGVQSLALVRATVAAAEAEMRLQRIAPPATPSAQPSAGRLSVLGKLGATLRFGATTTQLSIRHSEILVLLTQSTTGLSAAELTVALSDEEQAEVTIRAELSRLRSAIRPLELQSRPYRLPASLRTDIADVKAHLRAGRLRQAVSAYPGPVLPQSIAPGVEDLRLELHTLVRTSLLASRDADAVMAFADTAHGRDDYEMWTHALHVLHADSPRRTAAQARLKFLDQTLG